MSTFYVDLENGNDANDGLSFANRWLTLTSGATAARIAPGDIIRIMGSPAPTAIGQLVSWTNKSATLTLTTALTATVSDCDSTWTAATNVTATTVSSNIQREGTGYQQLTIAAGFTTGKVAYKALGASTDFSAYKQLTFWWRSTAVHAGTVYTVRLCSDTTGDVTVNTIAVPAVQTGTVNAWIPVTVDTGGALGGAIQSVAVYAESDPGAVNVGIDNIEACKDSAAVDAITLRSLLSKNADDGYGGLLWWPIRSIKGTTVILETNYASAALNANSGYYGTTESVATYKRETIWLTSISGVLKLNDSGSSGSPIVYSGGWNRTDMSTQDGATFVDNRGVPQNGGGVTSFYANAATYLSLSKVRLVGGDISFAFGSAWHYTLDDIQAITPMTTGIAFNVASSIYPDVSQITNAYVIGGQSQALYSDTILNSATPGLTLSVWVYSNRYAGSYPAIMHLDNCTGELHFYNCLNSPQLALRWSELGTVELRDCPALGLLNCLDSSIDTLQLANNSSASFVLLTGGNTTAVPPCVVQSNLVINQLTALAAGSVNVFSGGYQNATDIIVRNSTLSGGTISPGGPGAISGRISWANYNGTAGDHRIYTGLVTITADTTTRHTASGYSWKVLGASNAGTAAYPVKFPLGNIYCVANQAVTISIWLYRTNTGCGAALAIPKGRIPGAVADARTAMTAAINTWEQVSITFTPTADCIVPVRLEFGPVVINESVYFDDFSVSQSGTAPDFKTLDFAGLTGRPFLGPAAQSFAASSGGGLLSQRGFTGGLPG